MKRHLCALLAIGAALTAAPASAALNDCLRQDQIRGFTALNDNAMIVETIGHTKFKVNMLGGCPNMAWKDYIGFRTFSRSQLACVSRGDTMLSREFGGGGPNIGNRCLVSSVEPYTPAMEHADAVAKALNARH